MDADSDFDMLRRRSKQANGNQAFDNTLPTDQSRHSNPSSPRSRMGDSPPSTTKTIDHARALEYQSQRTPQYGNGVENSTPTHSSILDTPRHASPSPMSPGKPIITDSSKSSLSLPTTNLRPSPPNISSTSSQRADTLPGNLGNQAPDLLSPEQLVTLLENSQDQVLLLDLRVAPQYTISRIGGALNLCIPTTLLKRPSFTTQKLRDTFARDADRVRFSRWKTCNRIALYDSTTSNIKDAQTAIHVLKKFAADGWTGKGVVLKGGFFEFSRRYPSMIEEVPVEAVSPSVTSALSLASPRQIVAPVAGGCPMPTTKAATAPFFNNIRQNMDLLDGVGQLPVKRPPAMSVLSDEAQPKWLKRAVAEADAGKLVSDKFLAIERTEQKRMQHALDCPGPPSSGRPKDFHKVQIAGIERGAQNRYNNIFPYDHSRVHLEKATSEQSDYINASHIKASCSDRSYIATQAPIPATFADFWRLTWEQDVRIIVMLTAESEGGQLKSHPYWKSGRYGQIKVDLLSEDGISLENDSTNLPTTDGNSCRHSRTSDSPGHGSKLQGSDHNSPIAPSATVRHFNVTNLEVPSQAKREIIQLQYSSWPDFGAPAQPHHLLALIEYTDGYVRATSKGDTRVVPSAESVPEDQRPLLVHCSAGCGRTGTFCTVDSVIDMLKKRKSEGGGSEKAKTDYLGGDYAGEGLDRDDVDLIAQTVSEFRSQRLSMVQNLRQFVLCYECVLGWSVRDRMRDEAAAQQAGKAHSR